MAAQGEAINQVSGQLQFDEIGIWSEIKLAIIREYAKAYSTILSARTKVGLYHVYIDASLERDSIFPGVRFSQSIGANNVC